MKTKGQISLDTLLSFTVYLVILALFIALANSLAAKATLAKEQTIQQMEVEQAATAFNYLAVDGQYVYMPSLYDQSRFFCSGHQVISTDRTANVSTVAVFDSGYCNAQHAQAQPI